MHSKAPGGRAARLLHRIPHGLAMLMRWLSTPDYRHVWQLSLTVHSCYADGQRLVAVWPEQHRASRQRMRGEAHVAVAQHLHSHFCRCAHERSA